MNIKWNARGYADDFSFVHKYGEDVLSLLDVPKGSNVIDLGCGNGALSAKLRDIGYNVTGIDASAEMLEIARQNYSDIKFIQADATTFKLDKKADAIFSNAVFHWIDADKQEMLLQNIADNLRPSGQLVFEFGGRGCGETVHSALEKCFSARGLKYPRVFYFPTIGEYAPIMEKCGFLVQEAYLFDRPTPQKGKDGLKDWINMFVKVPFEGMTQGLKEEIINEAAEAVKDKLCIDGTWIVDYVRIRMKATTILLHEKETEFSESKVSDILIDIFKASDTDEVIDLALHFQNDGTRLPVTMDDQPDLLNIKEEYIDAGGCFWVAKDNGRVAGSVGLMPYSRDMAVMKKFFVYEPYQGKPYRLGQRLFEKLLDFAKQKGIKAIYLDTPKNTERAHRFYERAGFKKIDESDVPFKYNVPIRDCDFFVLEINPSLADEP